MPTNRTKRNPAKQNLEEPIIPIQSDDESQTNSTISSIPSLLRERVDKRNKREEARKRAGIDPEVLRTLPKITPLLRQAEGGIRACIKALRGDDDETATTFLTTYDGLSETDRKHLTIEDVCVIADIKPRKLVEVITGALMQQSDNAAKLIVASSKPKIIRKSTEFALEAKGEKDREFFLKHIGYIPTGPAMAVNVDARTQNNLLNAPQETKELAAPPPKADSFLLELSSTLRPEQKQLESPEPQVTANVPDVEYVMEGDVR